jgi:signal transduction histidine kinase/CHASE3 domain sensor protein
MSPASTRLRRSTVVFTIVALAIIVLSGLTFWELHRGRRDAEQTLERRAQTLLLVERLASATQVRSRAIRGFLLTADPAYLQERAESMAAIDALTSELDESFQSPESRVLLRRFVEAESANTAVIIRYVEQRQAGAPVDAFASAFRQVVEPSREALDLALAALSAYQNRRLAEARTLVADRQRVATRLVAALSVLGLGLALAGALLAGRALRLERQAREAERRTRNDKQFLDTMLDSLRAGILACDAEGRLTLYNQAAREFHGLPAAPTPAADWSRYSRLYEADGTTPLATERAPLHRALHDEEVDDQAMVIAPVDGPPRTMLASSRAIVDEDGHRLGAVVAMLDVTERLAAEHALEQKAAELERSNADLERFAYVASHDLQEPLRMVSSYTQLIARRYRGKLDSDADEFIAFAVDGVTRMQRLINDLLVYSRVSTRAREATSTDAGAAVQAALANLSSVIEESSAVVEVGAMPRVVADDVQLTQVIQNLVSNALKFRRAEGVPRITIRAAPGDDGKYIFAVQDNGIGIGPDYFERIFVLFQRLHTREAYSGTGIGLAICKKIVERHGGRIWVESVEGAGSTFYFTLPAAAEDAAQDT